ncbi:hypothetical protein MZ909_08675 [Thermosynechococcus sp. B0]|uniref:hypothetical protein n=1 Tax=unclassified Thermosynechococcus TaxID=2622553 RepID=UPI00257716AF|nr:MULTISPECIES: hypothetical protein [unclassified Thermosynechococcus]WJI23294.1 hypothetical protein MZ909_08675 [Thermosynechococcus sp. B0]WJI25811.1 hypothetical protein M0644_08745 [Thermosynechococcus sp. B1]
MAILADHHRTRMEGIIAKNPSVRAQFDAFVASLQEIINPSITAAATIEMLSQHLITKPVFDALFADYAFSQYNPVSAAMETMIAVLEGQALDKETAKLEDFYTSVKLRASGIDNLQGKQKIVIELYEGFFKLAFPKMAERLGIVYTPVEIVDFIIRSADAALQQEFGLSLASENVHILDPFTGTGTFIVRLLQSGLIPREALPTKYSRELHANEILLLPYYIAAINIETAYASLTGHYAPFNGL